MTSPPPQTRSRRAFTLLELLISVAILSLLVLMISQVIALVSDTWLSGRARARNFAQARLALGMVSRDLESMVLRSDLGAFANADGSVSALAFYTRFAGGDGDRNVSLVQYELLSSDHGPQLVRSDYGMSYSIEKDGPTLSLGQPEALPDLGSATQQELVEGAIAFRWQFLDARGELQPTFKFDSAHPKAPENTRTLIVSMLVLDERAFALARRTDSLSMLTGSLAGNPGPGRTYAAHWQELVDAPDFAGDLPKSVRRSLQVFERSMEIPL